MFEPKFHLMCKTESRRTKRHYIALTEVAYIIEPLPGGCACSHDPLIFLDFIPCSPLIKPFVPKNVFRSWSLDPKNFSRWSLDPQKCLSVFPIFVCLFYLVIHSRKNHFRTASFFSLESDHAAASLLPFLSSQLQQLPLRRWPFHWVWWSTSSRRIRSSSSSSKV